jgi:hypothetical protein
MPDPTQIINGYPVPGSVPAITDAFTIHRVGLMGTASDDDWPRMPSGVPVMDIELPTHGALQLTLADGTVLLIRKWASVRVFPPHA